MLESAVLFAMAVVYVTRALGGAHEVSISGYGTAGWYSVMGGGLLAAGLALWTGRRWGRGVAVFAQLLLLPVAWYMSAGSHQWLYGVGVGVVALVTLVLLFSPTTMQWWTGQDVESASADRSEPETR